MDTKSGEFFPGSKEAQALEVDARGDLETFEYGETVQIKSGYFEVCKIDLRGQRLILKPIPRPVDDEAPT